MKKFHKLVTGFALGVLVLLVVAASIDYRALDTTQFLNVSTVSVKSGAMMTNTIFYSTTGNQLTAVMGSQVLLDSLGRFSILWNDRTTVDAGGLIGSMNYGARYLTNALGGEFLNWNTGNITNVVLNALTFKTNILLTANISNGGSVILPGTVQGFPVAGDDYTISGWSITAMGTGPTCTIDVWKIANGTALPTVANTIMGTKPALVTGNVIESTTTTGWGTTVTKGDIWGVNVDACSVATNICFQVWGYRK